MQKLFIIVFLILNGFYTQAQDFQKEGSIKMISNLFGDTDTLRIWFRDSTALIEIISSSSETINDSLVKSVSKLSHYSILDLKTMRAQDYLGWSDTANPVSTYRLEADEFIAWNFQKNKNLAAVDMSNLHFDKDSMIDGRLIKLYSMLDSSNICFSGHRFGVSCPGKNNIFHLAQAVDEKFPGCRVSFVESEWLDHRKTFSKLEMMSNSLSKSERTVFDSWEKKLSNLSLPLLTQKQATQALLNIRNHKIMKEMGLN